MREAFAHDVVLVMEPGADLRAPGAAVTVALCGHWDHLPPCPLAPHHARAARSDDGHVHLRILFAVDPQDEELARRRIEQALAGGQLTGPNSSITSWRLESSRAGRVSDQEIDHAARLVAS